MKDNEIQSYGTLHIYSQFTWHFPAGIAGTREALESLRKAVDRAISNGWASVDAFTNDGEGYSTYIAMVSDNEQHQLMLPYTDEMAADQGVDKVTAEDIVARRIRTTGTSER